MPEATSQRRFRLGQIGSSSLLALAHGTNDAQKTMGVITLTLIAGGRLGSDEAVPFWVKFVCAAAIAAGTFSGGWRVIKTMGTRVTEVEPAQGFSAETSSATTILTSTYFGFPLSTTQAVSGGIMGTGLGKGGGIVHWRVVRTMVVAWLLTLPAAGLLGAGAHYGVDRLPQRHFGVIAVGTTGLAIALALLWLARRNDVTALNVIEPAAPGTPLGVPAPALTSG